MSQPRMFMRFASPNERRTISREDLGFYNALVIAAVYETANEDIDVASAQSFISPLRTCVLEYPYLNVVVKDKHTEKPYYEKVPTINLADHISIISSEDIAEDGEIVTFEKALLPILDRSWPAEIPPWRIVVMPLPSLGGSAVTRCFIAFAFSHTIGDGMAGPAFHRTFLDAWRLTRGTDEKEDFVMTSSERTLPAPFDTPERLRISWNYLLGPLITVYLPKFITDFLGLRAAANTIDAGTWTGSPSFIERTSIPASRVKLLEIEAPLLQKILQVSRAHGTKLTGTLHQLIVRALSKAIPNGAVTNFVSGTAVDMRGSVGIPGYTWGLYVSGQYDIHPRAFDVAQPPLPESMWGAARSLTKSLAECAVMLHDQPIGLLKYVPSIRNWTEGKLGHRRDCSYEVSNLLAFDGTGDDTNNTKISKMIFTQPANAVSGPIVFNIISVKGGSLMCVVSWQAGAFGVAIEEEMSIVDEICSSIRADVKALGDQV